MNWLVKILWLIWLSITPVSSALAQQGEVGDLINGLIAKGAVNRWLKNEPITTSIRDVNKHVDLADSFGEGQVFRAMHRQPRSAAGGYVLGPGFYELRNRSYCIKPGTHAPSNGDGYLYAPLLGRQNDVVETILAGSARHPEIDQYQVQVLLWAIIARCDFRSMNSQTVNTALALLTPGQIARLNKNAILESLIGYINSPALNQSLRDVFNAEHQLRQALGQVNSSFQDIERLAMLAGPALVDNPDIRRGRWSKHPEGYYVRYFPYGYARTVTQIYVPDDLTQVVFDATDDVAVPANTGAQRLAQSNVPYDTTGFAPEPPPVITQRSAPQTPASSTPSPPPSRPTPTPQPTRPTVRYQQLCGLVLDARTRASIGGATISFGDREIVADNQGVFTLDSLVAGQTIGFTASSPSYVPDTLEIDIERLTDCQPVLIELNPETKQPTPSGRVVALNEPDVREGDRIILENIQFEQSRSELMPRGKAELDKVANWMLLHKTAHIELSGHTSDEGDLDANLTLSKLRASGCKRYLLQKGIAPSRIKAVGYGQSRPLVPNNTADRAKNRRVELKIEQL